MCQLPLLETYYLLQHHVRFFQQLE